MKVYSFPLGVQQDTLHHQVPASPSAETVEQSAVTQEAEPLNEADIPLAVEEQPHPQHRQRHSTYEVLRQLPANATPAQQDSAIQAMFNPGLAGRKAAGDSLNLHADSTQTDSARSSLPQYYRENFFTTKSLYHPELSGSRYGVAGDPQPYSIASDNLVTGLLLGCFVLSLLAFARSHSVLIRQFKDFFRPPHNENLTTVNETSSELRFQFFLVMLAGLLISLLFYFYTLYYIGETFILRSPYYLILIYWGIMLAYFLLKSILYTVVNAVLFDGKRNKQWMRSLLFITSAEGILMFPIMMVKGYFDISTESAGIYVIIVLSIIKILTIFKSYIIFFSRNVVKLQIILYFCALEMVPLLFLWSILNATANMLKINI